MSEIPEPRPSPNAHFLVGRRSHLARAKRSRLGGSLAVSLASHSAVLLLFIFVIAQHAADSPERSRPASRCPTDIIWLNAPGPGGGGGGGGNKSPEPPKKAELPGKEKITVPVAKPPTLTPEPPKDEPKPEPQLNIPAVTTSAGVQEMPGTLTGLPSVPSQGSGSGGGAGTGTGTGIGPGSGSGLGPGSGGGTGGGVYRPGNGVAMPTVLNEVKPSYTADAMRQKIQGIVMVEAVVMPDGGVGQVQVVRSLDPHLRSRPGSDQGGAPVALPARHPLRSAGPGPRRNRADLYASLDPRARGPRVRGSAGFESSGESERPAAYSRPLPLATDDWIAGAIGLAAIGEPADPRTANRGPRYCRFDLGTHRRNPASRCRSPR